MHHFLWVLISMLIIGQTAASNTISQPTLSDSSTHFCYNGGTFFIEGGLQKCQCPKDYEGDRCETAVAVLRNQEHSLSRRICSHHCFNGGTCYFENETMLCKCIESFTGRHCETEETEMETGNERPKPWPDRSRNNPSTIAPSRNETQTHSTSTDGLVLDNHTVQTNSTNRTSIIDGHNGIINVGRTSIGTKMTTIIGVISIVGAIIVGAFLVVCYYQRREQTRYNSVGGGDPDQEEVQTTQTV